MTRVDRSVLATASCAACGRAGRYIDDHCLPCTRGGFRAGCLDFGSAATGGRYPPYLDTTGIGLDAAANDGALW